MSSIWNTYIYITRTCVALVILCCAQLAASDQSQLSIRDELAGIADQARLPKALRLIHQLNAGSVVSIHTSERLLYRSWGRGIEAREVEVGEGSGFIVASDERFSWLLTNAHVVIRTDSSRQLIRERNQPIWHQKITVQTTDDQMYTATPVGADTETDLALLRIDAPHLPAVTWGDSDHMLIGDWVIALGYPLGVGYSATTGIISATARSTGIYGKKGYESFLQTDAAINPGNSGGPLVNLRGEVIGVNANIISRTGNNIGIGFAIPANLALRVAEDLRDDGKISRPMIGIQMDTIEAEVARELDLTNPRAVVVRLVFPASPAEQAGLVNGDIILSINDLDVAGVQQLRSRIASVPAEEAVNIRYWRNGTIAETQLTPVSEEVMVARLERLASERLNTVVKWPRFGLALGRDARRGAVISQVEADSPAERTGLQSGDRIVRIFGYGPVEELPPLKNLDREQELVLEVFQRGKLYIVRLRR